MGFSLFMDQYLIRESVGDTRVFFLKQGPLTYKMQNGKKKLGPPLQGGLLFLEHL